MRICTHLYNMRAQKYICIHVHEYRPFSVHVHCTYIFRSVMYFDAKIMGKALAIHAHTVHATLRHAMYIYTETKRHAI